MYCWPVCTCHLPFAHVIFHLHMSPSICTCHLPFTHVIFHLHMSSSIYTCHLPFAHVTFHLHMSSSICTCHLPFARVIFHLHVSSSICTCHLSSSICTCHLPFAHVTFHLHMSSSICCCWSFLYSAILHSPADLLRLPVILYEWIAFYIDFFFEYPYLYSICTCHLPFAHIVFHCLQVISQKRQTRIVSWTSVVSHPQQPAATARQKQTPNWTVEHSHNQFKENILSSKYFVFLMCLRKLFFYFIFYFNDSYFIFFLPLIHSLHFACT